MGIEVCTSSRVADDAPLRSFDEHNMHVHARVSASGIVWAVVISSVGNHVLV